MSTPPPPPPPPPPPLMTLFDFVRLDKVKSVMKGVDISSGQCVVWIYPVVDMVWIYLVVDMVWIYLVVDMVWIYLVTGGGCE